MYTYIGHMYTYMRTRTQARIEEALMRERLLMEELRTLQDKCAEQVQNVCACVRVHGWMRVKIQIKLSYELTMHIMTLVTGHTVIYLPWPQLNHDTMA